MKLVIDVKTHRLLWGGNCDYFVIDLPKDALTWLVAFMEDVLPHLDNALPEFYDLRLLVAGVTGVCASDAWARAIGALEEDQYAELKIGGLELGWTLADDVPLPASDVPIAHTLMEVDHKSVRWSARLTVQSRDDVVEFFTPSVPLAHVREWLTHEDWFTVTTIRNEETTNG